MHGYITLEGLDLLYIGIIKVLSSCMSLRRCDIHTFLGFYETRKCKMKKQWAQDIALRYPFDNLTCFRPLIRVRFIGIMLNGYCWFPGSYKKINLSVDV